MIIITNIVAPEVGWPVLYQCPFCKRTEIVLNIWAAKPTDGDYIVIRMCPSEDQSVQFNHMNMVWGYKG